MPTARLTFQTPAHCQFPESTSLPKTLQTPFGLALVEIQGTIQVGDSPLVTSNLSLDEATLDLGRCKVGEISFTDTNEALLLVGKHQLLRGKILKLPSPLAVLKIDPSARKDIPVVGIVEYRLLFNNRPEPVL